MLVNKSVKYSFRSFLNKYHWVSYDKHKNNFGDILTPHIIAHLSDKKVKRIPSLFYRFTNHFFMIGSILQKSTSKTIIWGSGFISAKVKCKEEPLEICAVRGPLTKSKLEAAGIECPNVFGDPALLMPEIYKPKVKKKYRIGIIPHYVDKGNPWLSNFKESHEVTVIDVQQANPLNVIDEMLACDRIISSSLHGVIVADAYNIPSLWIEFSDQVVGEGFKFLDYFMSVKRKDRRPICIKKHTEIHEIERNFYDYKIDIDLEQLKSSCPL
ncbi:pyruvyltransferase [Belliella buryatensis]|uniref:Pyruvyltransferase n=1 Tax=Belliella buryatensis TaxID=1500549 RepID=A0A239G686_9BACT|nr:polysaccharide pyruvyl transferase family protein [Belliella buryatensis]SNS64495.1 pyruvyltransferase [Belliella buryatensis]